MTQEIALYRKYRPKKWSDVLGQDHIVKVIESSIKLKRISHAYLFTGARGTGKTSIARILASEIGCKDEDLYEIDAASNRGIDDIREIKQSVSAQPFRSPYKVYIVDEVHMLTKEAFNALLKTLEEPPEYVIFILATTEPEKLPETVISRCQVFNFKRPGQNTLKEMLVKSLLLQILLRCSLKDLSEMRKEFFRKSFTLLKTCLRGQVKKSLWRK
jgi:DNA polymerase III subunit gamma/tau